MLIVVTSIHCRHDDMMSAVDRRECSLIDVSHWMSVNSLNLNAEKMEFLRASSRHTAAVLGRNGPSLLYSLEKKLLHQVTRFKSLALSFNQTKLTRMSSVTATCTYWLRQLHHVQRSVDIDSTKMLVHAIIVSRVDNCNAVFTGSPQHITDMLQHAECCSPSRHLH